MKIVAFEEWFGWAAGFRATETKCQCLFSPLASKTLTIRGKEIMTHVKRDSFLVPVSPSPIGCWVCFLLFWSWAICRKIKIQVHARK